MFNYVWPIGLVILSNVVYQICAKSVSGGMNPMASLVVTYSVGAVFSLIMYKLLFRAGSLTAEFAKINFAPSLLGIVLVGLEVGFIYAYKAGWQISTLSVVQSAFLAIALIFVGYLLYHEAITWNKVAGVIICLIGLAFINHK